MRPGYAAIVSGRETAQELIRLAEPRFGDDAVEAVRAVLASGNLTQGPVVAQLEAAVAEFCGARFAVATNSGTTAIELALAALDVGPGDEVVVPAFTYPATGNAALQRGADLRFVDADPDTYCVDVDLLEAALGPRTVAVVAVDLFGLPADYGRIEPLLAERGIPLVCDAACALGGAIGDTPVGTFGLLSCFSFHPRKSLTTGEGGMVATDDEDLAHRLRRLRNHGTERVGWRSVFTEPGFNFRMSDINAAVGLVQVPGFRAVLDRRRGLADTLAGLLREVDGLRPQEVPAGHVHPYQSFVTVVDEDIDRDALIPALRERGVESTLGTYSLPAEPAFAQWVDQAFPQADMLGRQTLALPLHERLDDTDVTRVAEAVAEAIASMH